MAKGPVDWINPPEKHGKILRTDDGSNNEYQYQIPGDLTDPANPPKVGDIVTFTPGSGFTASGVTKEMAKPLSCSFDVIPQQGTPGIEVTFSWNTTGATSVEILPNIGVVPESGTTTRSIYATETFTLTARDSASGKEVSVVKTVNII